MTRYLPALLVALAGCVDPPPKPLAPPDVEGSTCESACANLAKLSPDACGAGSEAECGKLCEGTREAEAELDISFPTGCLTAAQDCEQAGRCK